MEIARSTSGREPSDSLRHVAPTTSDSLRRLGRNPSLSQAIRRYRRPSEIYLTFRLFRPRLGAPQNCNTQYHPVTCSNTFASPKVGRVCPQRAACLPAILTLGRLAVKNLVIRAAAAGLRLQI